LETNNSFKNLCKEKEKLYREELQHDTCKCEKDSNEFWEMVKKIRAYQSSSNRKQVDISPAAWFDYFQKLLNPELSKKRNNFTEEVQEFLLHHNNNCERCEIEDDSDILNTEITQGEIQDTITHLRNNKSPDLDGIPNEFYKFSLQGIQDVLCKLFNTMFKTGYFPLPWTKSIIIPLFKKGDRHDPNNYRGISLLDALSKIFTSVLNKRLTLWAEKHHLIPEKQAGFRAGYST
jgi:hypothetical protein